MRNGDFSELLANRGVEPEQHPAAADPAGVPERRTAGAEQRHAAVHAAARQVPREPVSAAELQRSDQPLQLRLQRARADQPARLQGAVRLEHQQHHEGLRPRRATKARPPRSPRGVWWAPADVVALPTPNVGDEQAASRSRATSSSVLSPSMTNEVLVSYSRLTLDNHFKDPTPAHRRAPAASRSTASSPPR